MPTPQNFIDKTRYDLFNTTGPRYELIMPAFGPLARSLVKLAQLRPGERVLDLGTGTGAVAFPAGRAAHHVAAIDYAPTMLRHARQQQPAPNITFYQGDMHRLPHAASRFEAALASFGLNGVEPAPVFLEVLRVLHPGGRLIFQEWGEVDEASKLVKETVKAHKVKEAAGFLADLRRLGQAPKAWDQLGGGDGVAQLLRQTGFRDVNMTVEQEAIPIEPLAFFKYKTAWAPYQAELGAMPAADRAAVESTVVEQLGKWANADGHFIWAPKLLRIIARK